MPGTRWADGEGGDTAATPGQLRPKHPNASLIMPLVIGDACQGLSGLYAAVNGVRLVLAHKHQFSATENHLLMRAGLRFLDGRLSPQQCVLNGLRIQLWRPMLEAIAEATRIRMGLRVGIERLFVTDVRSRDAAFDTLDEALSRRRVPMMLCRGGSYMVVSGATASSILLFDGDAYWLAKRACGVRGDGGTLRHVMCPGSFMAFVA